MLLRKIAILLILLINIAVAEISIDADKISYNAVSDIIIAEGQVVIKQFENRQHKRTISTKKIEYNRKIGKIKLVGQSIMVEKSGDTIKSDNLELDDDMKKGVINAMSIVFNDNSRINAESAQKNENLYSLSQASYSPCYLNKNCKFPLWDLYADNVTYDSKKKVFIYKNVKLRMKGHTILYTPYFSHPSFEVKRKSGLVTPIIHSNNDTGFMLGVPYFWALSPNKNLKITPFINFKNRGFVTGEYKEAFEHGDLKLGASFLSKLKHSKSVEERKTRWHFTTFFESYNLDNMRFIFDVNRASDTTYLLKYPIDQKYAGSMIQRKCNTSNIGAEFFDHNYFLDLKTYFFQIPDKNNAPVVFPKLNFRYEKENVLSGIASLGNDVMLLKREQSGLCNELYRMSNKIGWSKIANLNSGLVFDIDSHLRVDSYYADFTQHKISKSYPIIANKVICSYPLYTQFQSGNFSILEPKLSFSSLRCFEERYNLEITEDIVSNNFMDLGLFEWNRGGSIDYLEKGEKINWGLENSIYSPKRKLLNIFIGKTTLLNYKQTTSDIVGRIVFKPNDFITLRTRFVGFPGIEKNKALECGTKIQFKKLSISCAYFKDKQKHQYRDFELSQIGGGISYKINNYWELSCSQIFNFKRQRGSRNLSRGIFAKYKDECFEFGIGVYQSKYKDMDLKPKTGIMFSFAFKTLGGISQTSSKYKYNSVITD